MLHPGPKLLIITLRAMGDTLLATPLIRDLAQKYPQTEVHLLAEPIPAQAIDNNHYINRVWVAPRRGSSWKKYIPLIKALRRQRYSAVLDLLSTPGSALLAWLTGAPVRLGYRLRGRSWAYTHPLPRNSTPRYNPLVKFELAAPLGVSCSNPLPEIYPRLDDQAWADNFISEKITSLTERLGITKELNYILIGLAPWSVRAWRRWETEAWLEVMRRISQQHRIIWILFAASTERLHLAAYEQAEDLAVLWAGAASVLTAAALIQRCSLLLCAENGLKHIAVAAGTPTLTLYRDYRGVQPESWNPPDDKRHKHLVTTLGLSVSELVSLCGASADELL